MRQQFGDLAGTLRRQSREHVSGIGVGVVAIHACRLDQAHHRSGTLASPERAGKQPVVSANGNHRVILPMSGKKLKSSIAGIRCMDAVSGASTASSVPTAR
jgi:hypothetical protein